MPRPLNTNDNLCSRRVSARHGLRFLAFAASLGIATISSRYMINIGPVPPQIARNVLARPWLWFHASSASVALFAGPFQSFNRLRARYPAIHRRIGRAYILACLIGGVSGTILAQGTLSGLVGRVGFSALGIVWIYSAVQAWLRARRRDYDSHRRWAIRSFALTFSAVTLRLYLPILCGLGMDFPDAYRLVTWLCWVPNLLLTEFVLNRSLTRASSVA